MGKQLSGKSTYVIAALSIILTLAMAVAVVYFSDLVRSLELYGYLGAFIISILGGATIIVPVPMLAVVFAIGGIMKYPVLVGISAAMGETIGAILIYMTGYSGGKVVFSGVHGRLQAAYARVAKLVERRGLLILFILSSVINPFFYPAALSAGAIRLGIHRFVIVIIPGKTIKGMTIAFAGYYGLQGILKLFGHV